mmetsp:Transcript_2354/g.5616  ORF Transcript_2354/g.5616 Transcript_2354/m.5616 type:complete len:416 (-) Transcript_2354:1014-2261(-)
MLLFLHGHLFQLLGVLILFLLEFLHARFREFRPVCIMRGNTSLFVIFGILALVFFCQLEEVLGVDLHACLLGSQIRLLLSLACRVGIFFALADLLLKDLLLEGNSAVEDQSSISVRFVGGIDVNHKVSHSLELQCLVGFDGADILLVHQRSDGGIHESVLVNDFGLGIDFFLPEISGFWNSEEVVVNANLAWNGSLGGNPANPGLGLFSAFRVVQAAFEFLDLGVGTFFEDNLVADKVSSVVFEANRLVGSQTIIILLVHEAEITGVDVQRRSHFDVVASHGRIRRRVLDLKDHSHVTIGLGILPVGNHNLDGFQGGHGTLGLLAEGHTGSVEELFHLDNVGGTGGSQIRTECVDDLGRESPTAIARQGRHSWVVPSTNNIVVDQLKESALTENRVLKVQSGHLIDVRTEHVQSP